MNFLHYIDYILIGVLAVMLAAAVVMLFLNRLWVSREKKADAISKNQIKRLALILQTGKLKLWVYKVDKRRYCNFLETGEYGDELNPIDFAQFYDRDDFERLRSIIFDIREGKKDSATIRMKGTPAAEDGQRQYEVMLSILEHDKNGQPKTLLGIKRDITDKLKREQEVNQLLVRYHTVFNSALADMIYYDKDGRLSDINDKACSSFSINDRRRLLLSELRMEDNPLFATIDFTNTETTRTTAILSIDDLERDGYTITSSVHKGKYYYEASINPVTNQEGELEGVYVSGRNVTEMVESVHRQQEGLKLLRKVHQNIQNYIRNINPNTDIWQHGAFRDPDAEDIEPLPRKDLRIEFIGDSITCGYGVDDEDENHHFATGTEDATRAFAVKTAAALDADYSLVSYSGHGIISGYSDDGNRVDSQLVPPVYEQLGKNYGSASSVIDLSRPWDFSLFQPDFVVINLGTNDFSFIGGSADRREEYTAAYAEFLRTVRKHNPAACIIAALGVMGDDLFPCVQEAVRRYTAETGDGNLYTLRFRPQDGSTGYVADWHPTEATQELAARLLTGLIASLR